MIERTSGSAGATPEERHVYSKRPKKLKSPGGRLAPLPLLETIAGLSVIGQRSDVGKEEVRQDWA